jgi:hypothetical protein
LTGTSREESIVALVESAKALSNDLFQSHKKWPRVLVEVRICPSIKPTNGALVRDEGMREDSIEKLCDEQIRRRFAEWIIRAAERKSKADNWGH